MSFLGFADKTFLVFGVANRKSVAWHIAQVLEAEGARVVYSVRSEERRESFQAFHRRGSPQELGCRLSSRIVCRYPLTDKSRCTES